MYMYSESDGVLLIDSLQVKAANILQIPVVATEQYPKGLIRSKYIYITMSTFVQPCHPRHI